MMQIHGGNWKTLLAGCARLVFGLKYHFFLCFVIWQRAFDPVILLCPFPAVISLLVGIFIWHAYIMSSIL